MNIRYLALGLCSFTFTSGVSAYGGYAGFVASGGYQQSAYQQQASQGYGSVPSAQTGYSQSSPYYPSNGYNRGFIGGYSGFVDYNRHAFQSRVPVVIRQPQPYPYIPVYEPIDPPRPYYPVHSYSHQPTSSTQADQPNYPAYPPQPTYPTQGAGGYQPYSNVGGYAGYIEQFRNSGYSY